MRLKESHMQSKLFSSVSTGTICGYWLPNHLQMKKVNSAQRRVNTDYVEKTNVSM